LPGSWHSTRTQIRKRRWAWCRSHRRPVTKHIDGHHRGVTAFADALLFNWLIAGTDAHAKNYSLLIGVQGHVRLAPLYDIASLLAYDHIDLRAAKLAMRVGRHYRLDTIQARHWNDAARALGLPADALMQRLRDMTAALPDAIAGVSRAVERQKLRHPNLARLCTGLSERVIQIARTFH
jgi:serine/threonine-protein kinase HipA